AGWDRASNRFFPYLCRPMEISNIIEALIFAAEGPLKPDQILEVFQHESFEGPDFEAEKVDEALLVLKEKYESDAYVFELRQIDGGYQFYTKRPFYPYLRHAALLKNKKKLSRASLETLSIIAYRQPITKTEIEFIRGVNCDYAVRKLLDKKLVEIRGRSEAPGRPLLYGTSTYFMEYFGINSTKDLPKLEEIKVDEQEFQEQFKVYLKESEGDDNVIETPAPIKQPAPTIDPPTHQEEE
ncbi:MAG: SMC-Scp complex subunit ScpB, partial [Bacteroidota bacterium]